MQISAELPEARLNGHPIDRVPGNLNVTIPGILADTLMIQMKDLALSSGSACSSARAEPSHVLRAIGYDETEARMSVRFGVGRSTTDADVDFCARRVVETVREIREVLTPLHVAPDNAKKEMRSNDSSH
jgi:cysteine desulfurase